MREKPVLSPQKLLATFLPIALLVLAQPAWSEREHLARNKHRVAPSAIDGADMEVYSRPGSGGSQYFCAAADYAKRWLNSHNSDRVMVVIPEAPSSTKPGFRSVHFSVVPWQSAQAEDSSLALDIDRAGEELVIVLALKLCEPRRLFGFF